MNFRDIIAIAEMIIEEYGEEALALIEERIKAHVLAGEHEGEELWRRVAEAIRHLRRP